MKPVKFAVIQQAEPGKVRIVYMENGQKPFNVNYPVLNKALRLARFV